MPEKSDELQITQEALEKTYDWMQDWYAQFREKTGLSLETIASRFNLRDRLVLPEKLNINTYHGQAIYQMVDFNPNMATTFGPAAIIRLTEAYKDGVPMGEPDGIMVITPVGEYSKAMMIAERWRFGELDVAYRNLNSMDGQMRSIVQVTSPGVLFKTPAPHSQEEAQVISVEFKFAKNKLKIWEASFFPNNRLHQPLCKLSSKGQRVIVGRGRHQYEFPSSVDMVNVIDNIISQRPAIIPSI